MHLQGVEKGVAQMADQYEHYEQLKARYLSKINALEDSLLALSDNALEERALDLRSRVYRLLKDRYDSSADQDSDLLVESSDLMMEVLPEAFALVREVSRRLLGMRHYDEQIIGGVALHLGNIAELKNGEGKTIVALLPAYLNALFANAEFRIKFDRGRRGRKRSIHIMTTNDYLARRDYVWMRPVYEFLGVTVGYLQEIHRSGSSYSMDVSERKTMYEADVIYGSAQEFIFDYLRDKNVDELEYWTQGGYYFVIVDEVDHVLLDEAQTPHILSGQSPATPNEELELVYLVNGLIAQLYHDNSLVLLDNNGSLNLSRSGKKVLRTVGRRILEHIDEFSGIGWAPDRPFLIGLIFQFLEIISYQKGSELTPALLGRISRLSHWSKTYCDFYQSDQNGWIGFSDTGSQLLEQQIETALISWEDEVNPRDVIDVMNFVLKNAPYLGAEIFAAVNITPEEFRRLLPRKQFVQTLLGLASGNKQAAAKVMAVWVIGFLNDYIVDIARISFSDSHRLHTFLRNVTIAANALLPIWNRGSVPEEVWNDLAYLQSELLRKHYSFGANVALAPEAFAKIVEVALLPVVSNMLDPRQAMGRKDVITVALVILLRCIRDASQLHRPKTRLEREMVEVLETLRQLVSNKFFEYSLEKRQVSLTQWGQLLVDDNAEQIISAGLWSGGVTENDFSHKVEKLRPKLRFLARQCLLAYLVHRRNNEYVIQSARHRSEDNFTRRPIDREVTIVGGLTGRMMPGRRWSQWLHSFIEAKEGLPVKRENETLARISTQSYIALYPKIAGMTGTAQVGTPGTGPEVIRKVKELFSALSSQNTLHYIIQEPLLTFDPVKAEFEDIYGTQVIVVPEHRPSIRKNLDDCIYMTKQAKLEGVVDRALEIHSSRQPVLIETVSVEQSERIAHLLEERAKERKQRISIQLLNALTNEQEAEIITEAGLPSAVTVSTQLAGRGTDIVVSREALELGGLFVLGVERRDSRRWDDQIVGRAGRQGEPGVSQFFLSLQDDLMLKFGGSRVRNLMTRLDVEDDILMEHVLLTRSVLDAQARLEHYARQRRERTAGFDKIVGKYRDILYHIRQETLADSYICPLCERPHMRVQVQSEDWCCSACQSTEWSGGIPKWRLHFERLVMTSVDSCIGNANVEQYLVDKYTSDVVSPKRWEWDDLVHELREWLTESTTNKEQLATGIDFKNELYPEAERRKLSKNIRTVLVDDLAKSLFAQAQSSILKNFLKRDRDPLNWDIIDLSQQLNQMLSLSIRPTDMSLHPSFRGTGGARERLSVVESVVREAIRYKVSGYDWVYPEEATVLQLLNLFNPLLQEKITREDVSASLEQRNIKKFVLDHLARSYNGLICEFGKAVVFGYENEILRAEVDKQWRKMLAETELVVEELRGYTVKELVTEYGVRVAEFFQHIYEDIARETLRGVLLGKVELEKRRESGRIARKEAPRLYGDAACTCGSGKSFSKCCGTLLYQGVHQMAVAKR